MQTSSDYQARSGRPQRHARLLSRCCCGGNPRRSASLKFLRSAFLQFVPIDVRLSTCRSPTSSRGSSCASLLPPKRNRRHRKLNEFWGTFTPRVRVRLVRHKARHHSCGSRFEVPASPSSLNTTFYYSKRWKEASPNRRTSAFQQIFSRPIMKLEVSSTVRGLHQ